MKFGRTVKVMVTMELDDTSANVLLAAIANLPSKRTQDQKAMIAEFEDGLRSQLDVAALDLSPGQPKPRRATKKTKTEPAPENQAGEPEPESAEQKEATDPIAEAASQDTTSDDGFPDIPTGLN